MKQPFLPEEFAADASVSRETLERLQVYAALLTKWQASMSLVGSSTLRDIWRRHMLDSSQLLHLAPAHAGSWLDIGSGAGFPGLVLAILGAVDVHLVESNRRKCEFLREVARQTQTAVTIHSERIESLVGWPVDVVTARAVGSLTELLNLAQPFLTPRTHCLFPKGQHVANELTEAAKYWSISARCIESVSDPRGRIVHLTEVSRTEMSHD